MTGGCLLVAFVPDRATGNDDDDDDTVESSIKYSWPRECQHR